MPSMLAIRLDPQLEALLEQEAARTGRNKSDIVRDALRRQLWLSGFEEARRTLIPYAEAIGVFTDEDVFKIVS
ncbi:MAG: ribbon-helix-helix protein, CopG family [Steroidobacteraceae bacterium]